MTEGAAMAEGDPLDRAGRLKRLRRERLLALLPRIFAAQPESSVVGALLDAMAARLAELDEATERVLRDRWVALAGGSPRWDDGPNPLDLLGRMLGISQERWEETEAYRRRLRETAPILIGGSTTVRSLLTVAAASLDTELCPRLCRLPDTDEARKAGIQDTTLGLGVRPGTRAHCPGCHTPGERCVYEPGQPHAPRKGNGPIVARLLLTDSPVTQRSLHLRALGHDSHFQVPSASLVFDRPTVTLSASTRLTYPALQNLESNELMLFAGSLAAGETLTVVPKRTAADVRPFDGYTPQGPALDFLIAPGGAAIVQGATTRNVSDRIYYLQGAVFDEAIFDNKEFFSLLGRHVLSPRVDPGGNTWRLRGYTRADIQALADPSLREDLSGAPELPFDGVAGEADLALSFWVRLPASFRLRIPEVPARSSPEERTAVLDLTRRTVEAARAAGVRASVDFPEPPRREQHVLGEGELRIYMVASAEETHPARDVLQARAAAAHRERQPQEDRRGFTTQGVFDVTRFDWSHLALPET